MNNEIKCKNVSMTKENCLATLSKILCKKALVRRVKTGKEYIIKQYPEEN